MSKQLIFTCGHPYTPENICGVTDLRCRTCRLERQARARSASAQAAFEEEQARKGKANLIKLSKLQLDRPVDVADHTTAGMESGSKSLLRALYRSHPYVFDAAERQGRQAVRLK